MPSRSRLPRRARAAFAVAVASALFAREGAADTTPSLAFEPTPAGDPGFGVERAAVRGHRLVSGRVLLEGAKSPLVLKNPEQVDDPVVTTQLTLQTLVSFALWHRLVVHANMPFVIAQSGGAAPPSVLAPNAESAPRATRRAEIGDLRVGARARLLGTAEDAPMRADLALSTALWLPTASDGYAGDGTARWRASLVGSGEGQHVYWAVNTGLRSRAWAKIPSLLPVRVGPSLTFGAAAGFFAGPQRAFAIGAEMIVDAALLGGARFLDPRATVGQFLLTGRARLSALPIDLGAAFGPGFAEGAGAADVRVMGMIGYAPEEPPPPPDRDRDGIPDKSDACVDLPGVASRDPLLHGCPMAPPDRDGDGIPDIHDACPREPGEATYVRATHGCPRPEPGEGPGEAALARLVDRQIVIAQQVQFETGTAVLQPSSDRILGRVAAVMAAHPEVELIEVQGHTDDTGTPERNRRLGQERAESVVAWLVAHGVARFRLSAKGYGADKPLALNTTEEGRALNRRVEFQVLLPAPAPAKEAP